MSRALLVGGVDDFGERGEALSLKINGGEQGESVLAPKDQEIVREIVFQTGRRLDRDGKGGFLTITVDKDRC